MGRILVYTDTPPFQNPVSAPAWYILVLLSCPLSNLRNVPVRRMSFLSWCCLPVVSIKSQVAVCVACFLKVRVAVSNFRGLRPRDCLTGLSKTHSYKKDLREYTDNSNGWTF